MNLVLHAGQRALVLGLGRFGGGREAVRFLVRRGLQVRIADKSAGADLVESRHALADLELDWQLGREDADLLAGVDLMVVNPAVPDEHALLQAARERGVGLTQETNLFLDHYPGRVVAITGTNGKSTTSTLLHAALQRSGIPALLGGNIGHSLLADEALWSSQQVAVLEISSFQLDRVDLGRHSVHGAVFTRVLKDHVDRHKTLAAYHAAKGRLAALATGFMVHAADDPVSAAFPSGAEQRIRYAFAQPAPDSVGEIDGFIAARVHTGPAVPIVHRDALVMLGDFQRENVMAASAAAMALGAGPQAVGLAMACARPLPFRLQLIAAVDGVRIYDNGVSTEIESTRSALRALTGRIHWVGGGKSKDGDFQTVADGVADHVASAHVFGAAAEPMWRCLQGRVATTRNDRVQQALAAAMAAARRGDAILFSPAFASFDQYPNFRVRALEFHRWVAERRSGGANAAATTA